MFDDTLHFLANHLESPDWARLGEHLPYEWVEQAILSTEATSIRHRRLPVEQVVWLMVALALYRHKSISEVRTALGWRHQVIRKIACLDEALARKAG